jgi:subfamily B ATP-binding cassette protein MsbA
MRYKYKTEEILRRLIGVYISPYSRKMFLAIFFMIIVASCNAIVVKLVEPAIDEVFLTHDQYMLIMLPLITIGVFAVKGIAEYYQSYLIKYVGQRILTDLQIEMYDHLLKADLSFIQSQSSGRLISRFTNDISLMRGAVSNLVVGCAKHLLTIIFMIGVMFKLEPVMAIFVFFVFPIVIYPIQKIGRRMRKVSTAAQEELANYTACLDETFQSIKIVKSFSGEEIESKRALSIINNILEFYKKATKFDALTSPIMETLSGIAMAGIIWYGGTMVFEGKTTPGALFTFLTAFVSSYRPFKSLVSLNINLQEGLAAAKRVFYILDIEPTIKDRPDAKEIFFESPEIVFDNVSLKFDKKTAVESTSLVLQKGKVTALVGKSGSGKTSMANLLVRFYDLNQGNITIDGHDIKDITISSLRKSISLVTQDTILFDASVAENISYGMNGINRQQVIDAAKAADADEFIKNLPNGYDTIIGTAGMTLSGGQRQRISIARAFLKNAPILILDEATSSLDPKSEWSILESLKRLCENKTTLIITHKLSNLYNTDNIVVMKSGSILEQGTHEELMANKE